MKKNIILLMSILLLSAIHCFAQQNDLKFLVDKIKSEYPAFAEKTRGVNFDQFVTQMISENKPDTFKIMAKIVDFFHDRHLDLFKENDTSQVVDTEACTRNIRQAVTYLRAGKSLKKHEGFWLSDWKHCVVAIIQSGRDPLHYKAYLIECRDSGKLKPGLMVYDFEKLDDKHFFTKGTSIRDGATYHVHSEFRNDSVITVGPYNKWRKLSRYEKPILVSIPEKTVNVSAYWLDSNNYVITIPASTPRNGEIVDSIIKANPAITARLQNLIVDIRGNTGGHSIAFRPLMPLLYTNPILEVNSSIFCTADVSNNLKEDFKEYLAKGNTDSSYISSYKTWIKMEEDSLGKFLKIPQDTLILDTILVYPKRIAFVVDFGVQSAAEIILLNARQSKKVTFFGEHTMGAIDHLSYFPRTLPSGKYTLYIASSIRTIPEGQTKLDGIGIYPDVPIPDTEKDWVDFVKRYYEQHQ